MSEFLYGNKGSATNWEQKLFIQTLASGRFSKAGRVGKTYSEEKEGASYVPQLEAGGTRGDLLVRGAFVAFSG